jgi:carboxyl-terminal processing protease
MNLKNLRAPFGVIVLTLGIVLGIQIEKVFSGDTLRENLKKFSDVVNYTEKNYYEDVDTHDLVEAAIKGMLNDLDPHSVYIPASQLQSVEETFRGDFEGIGIEFQIVNDTLTVVSPITGGPSEELGIRPGDRIIKINGNDIIGITNDEVRNSLRGKAGTTVNVTITRYGIKEPINFNITRAKIPLYSVDTYFMLNKNTGYISVSRFSETTYDEVLKALENLTENGMEQLLLDLRGNPGGYLNQAFKMADLFIPGNNLIVYTKGRKPQYNEEYHASEPSPYEKIPIIVMINKGSASASEIVSGAIQDWDRGLIVGETSFGKGLVQRQYDLSDNSAIRLTISEYYTPSGRGIQRNYKDKRNRLDYYSEVMDREEEEFDNLNHEAEKDSLLPVFKTNSGRIVYGGGGITPDFIVTTSEISKLTTDLLKNNVFYEYGLTYLENNDERISRLYKDNLNKFVKEFEFTDNEIKSFLEYASSKGIDFSTEDYAEDSQYILARLKAQVARNYWKNEGWYSSLLTVDNQVNKAVTLFNEAKEIANLK